MEFAFFVFLIALSWRLRRAARRPQRLDVHHHHHFHWPDGGEPLLLDNVVPPVELGADVIRFPSRSAVRGEVRSRT